MEVVLIVREFDPVPLAICNRRVRNLSVVLVLGPVLLVQGGIKISSRAAHSLSRTCYADVVRPQEVAPANCAAAPELSGVELPERFRRKWFIDKDRTVLVRSAQRGALEYMTSEKNEPHSQ